MSQFPVVAVSANPAVLNASEAFLHALAHDGKAAQAYLALMDALTDRVISLFILEPAYMTALSPTAQKVVDFAAATSSKASALLMGQVFKKTTNAQFAPIAAQWRETLWPADSDNGQHAHLAYKVDERFAADFTLCVDVCKAGQGRAQMELIMDVFARFTDDIIDQLFLQQTRQVEVGFITRKTLELSVDGVKKAIHAVINQVLKHRSDEELVRFMGHYEPALKMRPARVAAVG